MKIIIKSIHIWRMLFILYTVSSFGVNMLAWNPLLLQVPLYLFFITSGLFICKNRSIISKEITQWYIVFFVWCIFSLIYSSDIASSVSIIPELVMAVFWAISIGAFLSDSSNVFVVKYANILTSIPMGIILIRTFSQVHSWSRLGEGFGMNENLVALCFLIPFCFAISEIYEKRYVFINWLSIGVCSYVILLTGSKKALIGAVLYIFTIALVSGKLSLKKLLLIFGIVVGTIALFNYIIINEQLYNILGYRLVLFWQTLIGKSNAGGSTVERGNMISYGFHMFLTSPVFGHGINSFCYFYGKDTGFYAYAHNNYVELASTLGLIGVFWYYSIHIKALRYLIHFKDLLTSHADIFALIVLVLFYDIAMVSYCDTRIILLIVISFSLAKKNYYAQLQNKEKEVKYEQN